MAGAGGVLQIYAEIQSKLKVSATADLMTKLKICMETFHPLVAGLNTIADARWHVELIPAGMANK